MKKFKEKIDCRMINGSDLAYIGDAYYELYIRMYLLSLGITKPNELHKQTQKFVSSISHALIVDQIIDEFTEVELDVYHRGRNYNYRHKPKNAKINEYLKSSGFEAVLGYLYLTNQNDRLEEIIKKAIAKIEAKNV